MGHDSRDRPPAPPSACTYRIFTARPPSLSLPPYPPSFPLAQSLPCQETCLPKRSSRPMSRFVTRPSLSLAAAARAFPLALARMGYSNK
ncbi:Hypothetical protein NTJ_04711 [Nesidiocoris tenuis]|uniref:Uncharacterized protein n=1 Tax=Nesidiocoris tenuis TaxID=355587 RepID=A0ABN7AI06_9HEMI|nr:Hypothetical protein NTJ_04711 [Nesidiocoris tenuis]